MGNMANPVLTRLGINQFWYKYWYSDKYYSLFLKQDYTLEMLLKFYLKYGLTISDNLFLNNYYYFNKKIRTIKKQIQYYRYYYYTNITLSIEHNYKLRINTDEYFPMRVWLFRYLNWFIFSIKWFKPLKKKFKKNKISHVGSLYKNNLNNLSTFNKRLKIYYYYILYRFYRKGNFYLF